MPMNGSSGGFALLADSSAAPIAPSGATGSFPTPPPASRCHALPPVQRRRYTEAGQRNLYITLTRWEQTEK
jgi:hypothetical protein